MANVNFAALLQTPIESAERPKNLPVGTYTGLISKMPSFGVTKEKETPYARLTISQLYPLGDVDPSQFADFGGQEKLAGKTVDYDFYLSSDAIYRLREFLEKTMGLNCTGRNFDQVLPELVNQSVRVHINHRMGTGQRATESFHFVDDILGPEA